MSLAKQLMASDQTFCIIISITIIFWQNQYSCMGNKYNKLLDAIIVINIHFLQ